MTTVADLLVRRLEARGIEVVFGIPGVDNLAFFDALERSSIRCVLVRHEATAGFAADAWFRLTGRPAVCFTTGGPGAANALTPMGEAWASGSTFLHLTTSVASSYGFPLPPRGLPHYHPAQLQQFEALACRAVHCAEESGMARQIDDVLDAMSQPPFRPGYLEIPSDVLAATATEPSGHWRSSEVDVEIESRVAALGARSELIQQAAAMLTEAERPLIWVGSGGSRDAEAVLRLAEALDAPVLLTHSAKRGFRHFDHPLVVAYPPHEPPVAGLVETSDVALVLGSDLDAMMTMQFRLPLPTQLIQIDVEPTHVGMQYPVAVAIVDTVDLALSSLLRAVETLPVAARDGRGRSLRARTETLSAIAAEPGATEAWRLLDTLDGAIPTDAIVVCDMAIAGYWAAGLLNLRAQRRLLYPIGWGTLGFGLPAAIGAADASPSTRTVCIAGDAGVAYGLGDLATIAERGLPITIVVVDDSGYGMLRYAAQQRFGRTIASDLGAPDFAALAHAFGIPAWSLDIGSQALVSCMAAAMTEQGPSLVHIRAALTPPRMALLGSPCDRDTSPSFAHDAVRS